jgi:signal transduction histidine kinase/ActR/RegA family two-component response regulator
MNNRALHILIAEDETSHADAIRRRLEKDWPDARIEIVASNREYRRSIAASKPSIAIIDLNLSDGCSIDLLPAPGDDASFPVIMMTSFGSEQAAVDAIKAGALDYIVKSADTFTAIGTTVKHALREWKLIQEKRWKQEVLRDSESFLRATLDALSANIAILDDSGVIVSVNQAWLTFAEANSARGNVSEGANYLSICDGASGASCEGAAEMAEGIRSLIRGERSDFVLEYPCHSPDQQRWFIAKATRFSGNRKNRVVVAHENITQRKVAELEMSARGNELAKALADLKGMQTQLIHQEKMASVGQLAAGVAHEINNPIGFVRSNLGTLGKYIDKMENYISLLEDAVRKGGDAAAADQITADRSRLKIDYVTRDIRQLIEESIDGTERVKKIVQDLKTFSRSGEVEMCLADINQCLDSTINIVWNEIKYVATLNKEYGELPALTCNPQQINQVCMNLLVNAAHAIVGQGTIGVRTWADESAVYIAISDTGKGIPQEHQNRIFDAFFTTKEVGKGTGLGLSISAEIVKKHGGTIMVASEVGRGSTFTVRLPLQAKQ